jgi:hypothetical protein
MVGREGRQLATEPSRNPSDLYIHGLQKSKNAICLVCRKYLDGAGMQQTAPKKWVHVRKKHSDVSEDQAGGIQASGRHCIHITTSHPPKWNVQRPCMFTTTHQT